VALIATLYRHAFVTQHLHHPLERSIRSVFKDELSTSRICPPVNLPRRDRADLLSTKLLSCRRRCTESGRQSTDTKSNANNDAHWEISSNNSIFRPKANIQRYITEQDSFVRKLRAKHGAQAPHTGSNFFGQDILFWL